MNYSVKICIQILAILTLAASVFSQDIIPDPPDQNRLAKFILADAQIAFEDNDFPTAFLLTQEAIDARKAESAWSVYTLETELRKPNAQKIGKDIEQLLYFFKGRQDLDVVQIIEHVLIDFTYEYFDYNMDKLLIYLRESANYPEANYLLGKLYFIEGELEIAESYILLSYDYKHLLDIPDVQFDILYSLADLYAVTQNWNAFEEVLLLIASEDESYYVDGMPSAFLFSVTSALKSGMDSDRFFLLFRNDYYKSLQAWNYLTYFYNDLGYSEKALEAALLYTTSSLQRIDEVLMDRDINYTYTTLEQFFRDVKLFNDIAIWAENNYFWEGFYVLAKLCSEQGYIEFAQEIFIALAMECPIREWRILSEKAL